MLSRIMGRIRRWRQPRKGKQRVLTFGSVAIMEWEADEMCRRRGRGESCRLIAKDFIGVSARDVSTITRGHG